MTNTFFARTRSAMLAIAVLIVSTAGYGCDSFLNEEPQGFLSSDNFYQSPEDARAALSYAYASLPEIEYYSRHLYMVSTLATEEYTLKADVPVSQKDLDQLKPTSSNAMLEDVFRYAYIGINRANAVIENVPGIEGMDESSRNQIVGEAHFLRALHHFNLVRVFGAVPVSTSQVDEIEETSPSKATRDSVYSLVIRDLERTAAMTDQVHRKGRANRVAAWALLARVHGTMASSALTEVPGYDFVQNPQRHYNRAETYARKVMEEQNRYRLDDNLVSIYDNTEEDSPERIFYVATDESGEQEGNYSKLPLLVHPYISGATITLPDGTSFPSGFSHMQTEADFYNSFRSGDRRKTELIVDRAIANGSPFTYPNGGLQYPFTRKFVDPGQVGQRTGTDTPVLRFSATQLMFAEAVGPTNEGYAAINEIRERAGLSALTPGLSRKAFRDSVMQERKWELAFEGQRLYDLRRTHQMEAAIVDGSDRLSENPQHLYYYPLPQSEVDLNPNVDPNAD